MTKSNPQGAYPRHKAMAMGEKIELKKGGAVKKAKGGCMNKGGKVVKKK